MRMTVFYHYELHPDHRKDRPLTDLQCKDTVERFAALPVVVPIVGDTFQSRYYGRVVQRNVNAREDILEIWVNPLNTGS